MPASHITSHDGPERRAAARARVPCRVVASGARADGTEFEVEGLLVDISSTGLLARLERPVEVGAWMIFLVEASADGSVGPYAPVRGLVVRAEGRVGGACDVAASFAHPLWGMPGEGERPIRCPDCGKMLGVTDGREARFSDIIVEEPIEVPCPGCGREVEWRPGE